MLGWAHNSHRFCLRPTGLCESAQPKWQVCLQLVVMLILSYFVGSVSRQFFKWITHLMAQVEDPFTFNFRTSPLLTANRRLVCPWFWKAPEGCPWICPWNGIHHPCPFEINSHNIHCYWVLAYWMPSLASYVIVSFVLDWWKFWLAWVSSCLIGVYQGRSNIFKKLGTLENW